MKKITCVVDNTVQRSSLLWGEHGLAFWIETDQGCVLFDTSKSGSPMSGNDKRECVVFSLGDALVSS